MENIVVKKNELLAVLNKNLSDHRQIFEGALVGFQREVEAELQEHISKINAGKRYNLFINKAVPTDHTLDYDRAIRIVEMAIGDTITLSERDFAQYVMDDWG